VGRLQRWRPSPSMVVAFVALFIAGAGTATAARLITGKQIKNNSITSRDVRNGSLLRRDFKSRQLPRGPQGLPGASGRAGRDGFGQVTYRTGSAPGSGSSGSTFIACPPGLVPVGGDAYAVDATEKIIPGAEVVGYFYANPPSGPPNAWAASYEDLLPGGDVIVEAICANASRTTSSSVPAKSGSAKPAKPIP
jgi:hypothetical protein